jgi:8-oxo-dGTP pyrophosphatase MutT (NUDIX family)
MYKIYINDTPLQLVNAHSSEAAPSSELQNMVTRYSGNPKSLLNYHDMLEKNTQVNQLTLYANDEEQLFRDFSSQFKVIEASGGLVFNEHNELLMIYRLGYWDLPKGKMEKEESKEEAAVREVQEETGIKEVELGDFFHTTYHTYRNKKNKRVLKRTYWFRMKTTDTLLVPQKEESIEQAVWRKVPEMLKSSSKMYGNIKTLLEMAAQST